MTQPSPTSSLEQEEHAASGPRASRSSRVSRSLSAMGFFQQNEDSSESTLSSAGRRDSASRDTLDPAAYGVLTGAVGGSFGPFPRSSTFSTSRPPAFSHRDSLASSSIGLDPVSLPYGGATSADSPRMTEEEYGSQEYVATSPQIQPSNSRYSVSRLEGIAGGGAGAALLWEKEPDDFLHDPDPALDKAMDKQMVKFSIMAFVNTAALLIVVIVLVGLFAGWPIYRYVIRRPGSSGLVPELIFSLITSYAIDGAWGNYAAQTITNSTGQVPQIPNLPSLIDDTTPSDAYTRTGFDGQEYELVFSDEFNTDGRTFWPGDDPYWEAVDLHYWATKDLEWYDPDAVVTEGGDMVITMTQEPWNGLNFRSGMVQSWNKMCFTGGYVEFNVSLPGLPTAQGLWPGLWTMGNLGRAGYGSSVDGLWPYTYNDCDVGTLPNQTWPNGTDPVDAKKSGSTDYGGELSYRLSACTCPADADEHPGPSVNVGRGAPEIDVLEGQISPDGTRGWASQSIQFAPFDPGYLWRNDTEAANPGLQVWNKSITTQSAISQESASFNTLTDATSFEGRGYSTYGYEYDPGADGRITWAINREQTWQLNAAAMQPNSGTQIGQRLISVEPMYMIMNLGGFHNAICAPRPCASVAADRASSYAFQTPQWGKLQFPAHFRIDYVRVYQKSGQKNVGCDPKNYPTSDYINNHMDLYTNPNMTMFSQSNYTTPRNRLGAFGCSKSS
ncbi:hypothetical protein BMF94_4338 [Rhodotorula taiwanensis]|uniref:GH16 domain-containing protein n=1 Tax=Rhodotorula taiwanensis TaxID=741276 RepID=A0A2S5B6V4_9BASI|nr:hypothetical protein BMF94_4338 [Rhodotorula taiwanensis]